MHFSSSLKYAIVGRSPWLASPATIDCPAWLGLFPGSSQRGHFSSFQHEVRLCPFPAVSFEERLRKSTTPRNIASFSSHSFLMRADLRSSDSISSQQGCSSWAEPSGSHLIEGGEACFLVCLNQGLFKPLSYIWSEPSIQEGSEVHFCLRHKGTPKVVFPWRSGRLLL